MSFHVSVWSVKNPVPTIVLFLVLGLCGFLSFLNLGIDSNPNIDLPTVQVTVAQAGAGPTELETQVTKRVEDAVAGLGDIDELRSTVTEGRSVTTIIFDLGVDTDRATNDVRNAIDQIRQDLPQDVEEPIVQRLEFIGSSVMSYAVGSKQRSVEELSELVDRTISRDLLSVPGVAEISRLGGVDREIRVDLDPERLISLGITATEVNDQIRQFNINLPSGRAEVGGVEQNIRTIGSAQTVDELARYRIGLPSGESVPLSSLGKVEDRFGDLRQGAWFNTQPVVAFSVLRSSGSSLVTVEEGVREAVEKLQSTLPEDIEFNLIFTRADTIRDSYRATIDALVLGSALTALTVGIFLRDWRVTLITSVALPLSIVPTFLVMQALDYTLNSMTLLALALAVGNLVDDAICTIENIDQHLQKGKKPRQAAMDGAREIGLAVVATTATIVAVFVPVAFMGGIPGQFFQPFGIVVSVSTMFSTLVAVTMTPMLSAYLLQPKKTGAIASERNGCCSPEEAENASRGWGLYRGVLRWALRNRIVTLLIAVALFIGSLQLVPYIPKGLFDSGDTGLSTINVELPPGSRLQETRDVMFELTEKFQRHPATESVLAQATSVNEGRIFVNLKPKSEREVSQQEFQREMRTLFAQIPGTRLSFRSQGAGGTNKDVEIVLKSDNPQALSRIATEAIQQMRALPSLVEVTSSASLVKPEIAIVPDIERAGDLGVSVSAIARTASLASIGDNDSSLAKFDLPDRQIPIRVQIDPERRDEIATLRSLEVPGENGTLVPLSAVAEIRLGSGPAQIDRFDRARQISLEANLGGVSLGEAIAQVNALPALQNLPDDVAQVPAGDAEIMRDIFSRFLGALGLAVLSIYAILVLLYNNFLYPFAILVALPLSIGGALLALLIAQKELGLFALIGIVLLMGLVTKNAILLVDFALAYMQKGNSQRNAVLNAGTSRLRPILMTSVSTIAGMMPIALEIGAAGEVRSPMAIAVIGGFSTSTLLTLVVVPVWFTFVDNINYGFLNLFQSKERRSNPTSDRPVEVPSGR